jgi:hypothetical protein
MLRAAIICLCVLGGAAGGCAGPNAGADGATDAQRDEQQAQQQAKQPTPPVQFLYRRDRERLREQKELAGQIGTRGASDTSGGASGGASGGPRSISPEIAALFDLTGAGRGDAEGVGANSDAPGIAGSGARVLSGDRAVVGATFDGATAATLMQFDLSTVRGRVGDDVKYTLQVARYGHADRSQPTPEELAGFREAAEQAVLELRREGDEAYFYHGPFGSSVTVGLFTEADYVTQIRDERGGITNLPKPYESATLSALRAKYPHNLVNGKTLQVRRKGSEEMVTQGSFLVGVPR